MEILVLGGTGVVGRPLLPLLVASGHRVRAVARSDDRAARVAAAGAAPIRLPSDGVDDLAAAMAGCDAVVDLRTHVPPLSRAARRSAWREHDALRDEGTRRLVVAAERAGVRRVVRDSVTFLHADGGEAVVDEDWPLDPGTHLASSAAGERHVAGFAGEGVVLRLAHLYGPDSAMTRDTARLARLGVVPLLGPPRAWTAALHTDDAASAVAAALTAPPGTYDVADGTPLRRAEVVAAIGEALGRRRLRQPPAALSRSSTAEAQTRSHRLSPARFRSATGWEPRWPSQREGWAGVVEAWERSAAGGGPAARTQGAGRPRRLA
jgi:nucleoside-diphosphate-sugar epimerase